MVVNMTKGGGGYFVATRGRAMKSPRCIHFDQFNERCRHRAESKRGMFCHWHDPRGQFQNNLQKKRSKNKARPRKIFSKLERRAIFERGNGRCYLCGESIDSKAYWEIDHIVPFSKGGSDDFSNLLPTHKECNAWKLDTELPKTTEVLLKRRGR